jgi:hydrogenase-4 component F
VFGSLLHLINNGLTKGVLFLAAANINRAFGSKRVEDVSGAIRRLPLTGTLFLAGFFAITGSPPFGPFFSEFTILRAAVSGGHPWVAGLFLTLLFVVFVGMSATVFAVVQGEPSEKAWASGTKDNFFTVGPIFVFLGIVLLLGVYVPPPLNQALHQAAVFIEATP